MTPNTDTTWKGSNTLCDTREQDHYLFSLKFCAQYRFDELRHEAMIGMRWPVEDVGELKFELEREKVGDWVEIAVQEDLLMSIIRGPLEADHIHSEVKEGGALWPFVQQK